MNLDELTYDSLKLKIKALESSVDAISILKKKIKLSNSFLDMLFNTIPNPIFYKDKDGIYQHCNDAFSKTILGISKDQIIGKSLYEFPDNIPKELADLYYKKDNELFENPGTQNYEGKVKCADGVTRYYNFYKSTFMSDENKTLGIVGVMLDISEHKKVLQELEEKNKILNDISIVDPLTQLYNRRYFEQICKKKVSLLKRHKQLFAFMFIDVDFFKNYNDAFGHQQGDITLKKIADILKGALLRPTDYAFRIGGEEFGLLYSVKEEKKAIDFAKTLIKKVEDSKIKTVPTEVSKYITISAGLAVLKHMEFEKNYIDKMYAQTDKLLYFSKKNGRNQLTYKTT